MSELVAQTAAPLNSVQVLAEGKQTVFSTIKGDDVESRLALFSAVTDSVALEDNLNKPIKLANIVVQSIEMVNEESGELQEVPRTILIDGDNVAYHAISKGLFRSVENLVGILGSDPAKWGGLSVIVTREGTGNRKYFTMRAATAAETKSGK